MPIHRLYVCTTCVRDRPLDAGEQSLGALLANAVEDALQHDPVSGELDLLRVPCLNGCLSPCNVAFRASGKFNLRFSRMSAADAPDVVRMLTAYMADPLGDPREASWPPALQGKRTVRTPPPQLLLRSGPRRD